jgi:hypothetical protein
MDNQQTRTGNPTGFLPQFVTAPDLPRGERSNHGGQLQ